MNDRDSMVRAINEYCRAMTEKDKHSWLTLFSENITHEDPVGTTVNTGIAQVSAFWDSIQAYKIELWLSAPIIVCGNEAIAPMKCRLGIGDERRESSQIFDQFIFADNGKITAVRAYYENL